MPKQSGTIKWTGKNFAEVRQFHKDVAHYPADPDGPSYPRDASQHPDNLHVHTDEGHTLVAAVGDTLVRGEDGRLTVEQTAKTRPAATGSPTGRVISAEGRDSMKGKGGAK